MKKLWFLLLIPALLILWWAIDRRQGVPSVHYAEAKLETIESIISTNGKLEPVDYAAARAEIAGVVQNVFVERGQTVKTGQPLVVLDNTSQRAALDTARAQLEQAKAEVASIRQGGKLEQLTDINGRLQSARLSLADAQRRLESTKRLVAKNAAPPAEQVAAEAAVATAQQQVQSLENNRKALVAPSDLGISEAKLRDAQAAMEVAQHRLDQSTIKSPIDGVLYQFDVRRGAYLEVGALVAMIGKLDTMRVRVYVDEPDLGRVSLNLPVDITWEGRPGQKWHGRVVQLPTEVTALNTRQVGVVTCTIDNPGHDLAPGANVDAAIVSQVVRDAVSIPKQALQTRSQEPGVWKLGTGGTISWQPVTAGVSNITSVQIKSGLKKGDRVILPSDATLSDGMRVRAVPEQAEI